MTKKIIYGLLAVLVVVLGGLLVWQIHTGEARRTPEVAGGPLIPVTPSSPAPAVPQTLAAPAIKFPVQVTDSAQQTSPLPNRENADSFIAKALTDLLGVSAVKDQLQLNDFVHHCVATTDNLGRSQAPSIMWPVNTTPDRFASMITESKNGTRKEVILVDNDRRYAPFINMIDGINMSKVANLYFHLYPLFQQQYEELGYPQKYFNDRLVEVLDLLISTPDPVRPLEVHLVDVEGNVKSTQPWVRYEFTDPALQSLSSGQKILLRIGKENGDILRHKLIEFRKLVTANPQTGKAQ
jgi:hypothetical protein